MKTADRPYRILASIQLPGGGVFDVWSNYAIFQEQPAIGICRICPQASPKIPDAYWPLMQQIFADAGLVDDCHFLHWVGEQLDIEHTCTCFGLPPCSRVEGG